ncbi:MAG: hypothetical protein R3293_24725 [Candidatus Promineifilaceae bacterium]|nr:hypothetical protein [Candidatus Promineifilaceae bacterium]
MENSLNQTQLERRTLYFRFLFGSVIVLLLAAAMRLVALQDIPPGLAQDEVLNADVASFIRQGNHAIFFREGYGHEPLFHYFAVPFQLLIGDNFLSIRLPAVFLGLLMIALTMRWTLRDFGLFTAVATGFGLAISWWPIIFSRVGIRPIMEPLFLVLFAWFWPRRPWVAGLILGLSVYTYTGARVVFLLPILLLLYWLFAVRWVDVPANKIFKWRIPRPQIAAVVVLLTALIVVVPLFITLRADPSLQQRVQQLEGPLQALLMGDLRPVLSTTASTLGIFSFTGDPRWTYSLPGRPFFDYFSSLFFYGGFLLAIWRIKQPTYAFVILWLLVGLIPSAITPQAPSTVRMVGAMPVVYLLPAVALNGLWKTFVGRNRAMRRLLVGLFTVVLMLNLFLTIQDGFVRWPNSLETRTKYQTVFLDIARNLDSGADLPVVIADAFYRPITADTLKRDMVEDLHIRWIQTGSEVAGAVVMPAESEGLLFIPEYAAPDPQLLAVAGISAEPLFRSPDKPGFAVYSIAGNNHMQELEERVTFDDKITLVGYDTSVAEQQQSIQLFLAWRVEDSLPADLASFVHWLDAEGTLISQYDGFDAAPETLRRGDLVIQRYILLNPTETPIDTGLLHIGLYGRVSGERLFRQGEPTETIDRLVISQDAMIDQN